MKVKVHTSVVVAKEVNGYDRRTQALEKFLSNGYKVDSQTLFTPNNEIIFIDTFTKEVPLEED